MHEAGSFASRQAEKMEFNHALWYDKVDTKQFTTKKRWTFFGPDASDGSYEVSQWFLQKTLKR